MLEETAATLFPSHTYTVEVGRPTSISCTKQFGLVDDRSRTSVRQELFFDLEEGDDPLAMAAQVVEYWESRIRRALK